MARTHEELVATRRALNEAMRRARYNKDYKLYSRIHKAEAKVARALTRLHRRVGKS